MLTPDTYCWYYCFFLFLIEIHHKVISRGLYVYGYIDGKERITALLCAQNKHTNKKPIGKCSYLGRYISDRIQVTHLFIKSIFCRYHPHTELNQVFNFQVTFKRFANAEYLS